MAKSKSVWGIDIGQSALKAMRCSLSEDGSVVASSYDYIEYPKILSQPDADSEQLVHDALETFLERNELEGDTVAMSVSGQAGLSRFFRPPPVDAKTLPDIVKYEVKQQIPFPIEDVIWDWQCLGGSSMEDVIVDAEVGLFAIKRDTVYRALRPFMDANVEVDLVQLSPLAVYNVICHDVLKEIPDPASIDPENPPESLVVLSMGTDATDLIITNGVKLWLRNIPIGGNHFTKQLSRELKLTHAKAEHLKRNVRQMAENEEEARRVFQSMRPVFNDLVTEIQRSLTFFAGIEKNAKIERVVLLGNAARLPGLRQYLNKQLELDIVKVNKFEKLTGPSVVNEKSFTDNTLSFTPCYGLCLQGLKKGQVDTNLLPHEFVQERMIRAKKPWVLAAVAVLVVGMAAGYLLSNLAWWRVDPRYTASDRSYQEAFREVDRKVQLSQRYVSRDERQTRHLQRLNMISAELSDAAESRRLWPELLSAVYQFLPKDPRTADDSRADPLEIPFDERREIYIDSIETQYFPNLVTWRIHTKDRYLEQMREYEAAVSGEGRPITETSASSSSGSASDNKQVPQDKFDLSGQPGWVVEIEAYHFHNSPEHRRRSEHLMEFVRKTLLKNMLDGTVTLPGARNPDGSFQDQEFTLSDIGIYYPTIVRHDRLASEYTIPYLYASSPRPPAKQNGESESGDEEDSQDGGGQAGTDGEQDSGDSEEGSEQNGSDEGQGGVQRQGAQKDVPDSFTVNKYDFTLQFAWVPTTREQRLENRRKRLEREAQEEQQQGDEEQGSQ